MRLFWDFGGYSSNAKHRPVYVRICSMPQKEGEIVTGAAPKNIIICCDGTGNDYGVHKTNVVRVCEIAVKSDSQLVYYDPGIGTDGESFTPRIIGKSVKNAWQKMFGTGLQRNVGEAYRFLMKVYRPGDRVYIFGFSRGAYTARSLAGMLYRCGLLHFGLDNLVEQATNLYNKNESHLQRGFKDNFCARPCPVHFIGVWDTVESLGVITGRKFHDCRLNPEIKHAYHAVSLDEKRSKVSPCLWEEANIAEGQTMEQVWFAGVHCDVGGWYEERGLSDIALRWMLKKAEQCGMQLDSQKFVEVKGDFAGKQHESLIGIWKLMGESEREVPSGGKVHESVKARMEETGYTPVKPLTDDVEWVE